MKITINREHCVDGLQKAGNVTPARAATVMLKTTWIRTDRAGKSITLMASNGYTEYLGTYPAEVEKDGFVGVYGKSLADLLRALPEGSVDMFTDRRAATWSSLREAGFTNCRQATGNGSSPSSLSPEPEPWAGPVKNSWTS